MAHNWHNSTRTATLPANWKTLRLRILRRDRWLCQIRFEGYCTVKATDVDHIGNRLDHRPSNLQASCGPCNQHKNVLTRPTPRRASERRAPEAHPGLVTHSDTRRG